MVKPPSRNRKPAQTAVARNAPGQDVHDAPSRHDLLVERLRERFQAEAVSAGDRLPSERELARQLNVTRGDIRRAIGYLAALGVLEVRHGIGAFLAAKPSGFGMASPELLRTAGRFNTSQMFEARRCLETELAGLAAARCAAHQLQGIADELAGMAASLEQPDRFLMHDVRFHRVLAAAAGNPILAAMMESIAGALYRERESAAGTAANRQDALRSHRAIYAAVERQDSAGARSAMHLHLDSAEVAGSSWRASVQGTHVLQST